MSSSSSSDSDSDSSSGSDDNNSSQKLNQSLSNLAQNDDLVSVTVRKNSLAQKAGVSLVERKGRVFVTNVTENGLFYGTEIEVGDVVLSINGKRLQKDEGAKAIIKHIAKAKTTVTMVVKKANRKARRGVRSLSPTAQRRKRGVQKIFKKAFNQNEDGSLKYGIKPTVDNIKKHDPNDDKPQIPVSANKLFASQDIGVRFKDIDKMIFVSAIAADSIFQDTDLELGDRVVGVQGMDFMSYGNSKYALQVIGKAPKEVSLVVEKEHDNFDRTKDVETTHDTAWVASSGHSERKAFPLSQGAKSSVEKADSDDENLLKLLERAGHLGTPQMKRSGSGKQTRKMKVGSSSKSPSSTPKALTRKSSKSPGNSSSRKPIISQGDNDSDNSSLGDFVEVERKEKLGKQSALPKSPNKQSISKLNQSSNLTRSVSFDFDNFDGDFIKVTVQKESEAQPGITLEKTEGKFLLTSIPQNEKRIWPGMQVLAINGVVNLHTISKAEDLINRRNGEIELIIDFSSPLKSEVKCPCCSRQMTLDGKHANGSTSRRVMRRKVEEPIPANSSEIMSVAASEITTKVKNKAPPGMKRVQRVPERAPKYQFDEFDSDSEDEGHRKNSAPSRAATSRYEANDKFMVRVSKTGKGDKRIGIGLLDHKGEIYVSRIDTGGLFYATPILPGDKVLSVNGRKMSTLKSAANVLATMEDNKDSVSIFVLRPDPNDKDYKEALSFFPE